MTQTKTKYLTRVVLCVLFVLVVWGGCKVEDYWLDRAEVDPFAYAEIVKEFPSSSPRTKALVRSAMAKGFIRNSEYFDNIMDAMVDDHPAGITVTNTVVHDPGADKNRLLALLAN